MARKNSGTSIKVKLTEQFGGTTADWKRIDKRKTAGGDKLRTFENAALNLQVLTTESKKGVVRLGLPQPLNSAGPKL